MVPIPSLRNFIIILLNPYYLSINRCRHKSRKMERLIPVPEPESNGVRIKPKFGFSMLLTTELHVVCIICCLIIIYISVTLIALTGNLSVLSA